MDQRKPKMDQPPIPMTFRLVAKGGKWEVHTAVPPSEGLELTFMVETITPRSREGLEELA